MRCPLPPPRRLRVACHVIPSASADGSGAHVCRRDGCSHEEPAVSSPPRRPDHSSASGRVAFGCDRGPLPVLQVEAEPRLGFREREGGHHAHVRGEADDAAGRRPASARADRRPWHGHEVRDDRPADEPPVGPAAAVGDRRSSEPQPRLFRVPAPTSTTTQRHGSRSCSTAMAAGKSSHASRCFAAESTGESRFAP
jgi:hypothetical protein